MAGAWAASWGSSWGQSWGAISAGEASAPHMEVTLTYDGQGAAGYTQRVVRGRTVTFALTFENAGTPVSGRIRFRKFLTVATVDLPQTGADWTYELDTGDWPLGLLYWSAYAIDDDGVEYAADGVINLVGNSANIP